MRSSIVHEAISSRLPPGWFLRIQQAIALVDSEPEPDGAVVRGTKRSFVTHHPGPTDIGLLVEVSESSVDSDRDDKGRVYARAGISTYWLINLVDRRIEVYTAPSGPTASPTYNHRQDYLPGDSVPLTIGGVALPPIPVQELLP